MTTWLLVVVASALVAVVAHAVTNKFWAACFISVVVPVVPILALGWHHVEHWYSEPMQLLALALASSLVAGGVVRLLKNRARRSDGAV